MKPIDFGLSDIPSDFRLEKYDVCSTWGVEEWCQALTDRAHSRQFLSLQTGDLAETTESGTGYIDPLRDVALGYLADPSPHIVDDDPVYPPDWQRLIRDLTGSDLYYGLFRVGKPGYEESAELAKKVARLTGLSDARGSEQRQIELEAILAMRKLDEMPAWQIHRHANSLEDKFWIEVELGSSDDELVKQFKRWLKQTRKDAGLLKKMQKRFRGSDFADWHSKRLLPYLDLTLWARAHGGSLSSTVLGSALFPNEPMRGGKMRTVEPMIRRTVAPQAEQLLSWQVRNALHMQTQEQTQKQ